MKRLLLSGLLSLALIPAADAAPEPIIINPQGQTVSNTTDLGARRNSKPLAPDITSSYTNNGVVTAPPVIDALSFVNYGSYLISTVGPNVPLPFETFDTLNFTNYGVLAGENGWRFSHTSSETGIRSMASSFANLNSGIVEGLDPFAVGLYTAGACAVSSVDPSYLIVWATNIINGGGTINAGASLTVGANGLLQLDGHNVDLAFGGVQVRPVWDEGAGSTYTVPQTNFTPDIAIYDNYAAQTNFSDAYTLNSRALWDGSTARAPAIPTVANGFTIPGAYSDSIILANDSMTVTITNFTGSATNVTGTNIETFQFYSNYVKQAIFVGVPAGFVPSDGFGYYGSFPANNIFQSMQVIVYGSVTNIVTGQAEAAGFWIADQLPSDTRQRGLAQNALYCGGQTSRPANYFVDRLLFGLGFGGDGPPEPDFFVDSGNQNPETITDSVTNAVLNAGAYAGYGFFLDNLASRIATVPGASPSNMPGRIVINADNLDLTEARVRGEGQIRVSTPHLISSTNAVIDCENLSFDLGSESGNLKVKSLAPDLVSRLKGNVYAWSATWSNLVQITLTNYAFTNVLTPIDDTGTNFSTNVVAILAPLTNSVSVGFAALMVDARQLTTVAPVYVADLVTHSRNVTFDDNLSVVDSLLIDGQSLTVNGDFTIPGIYPANTLSSVPPLQNWVGTNAPALIYFTNNGTFNIVNLAHFGDDRPPYAAFINNGTFNASGISLNSEYFENSGSLNAVDALFGVSGALFIKGGSGRLENGNSTSGNVTRFDCSNLKFNNYRLNADGKLFFNITNSLSDAGAKSGNVFQLQDGFNLMIKPEAGDLLGTTIQDNAPSALSVRINHTWAGEDRGATPAGFVDNTSIGVLQLTSQSSRPLFVFAGTGAQNGMYVDLLDLSSLDTNFLSEIQIQPNLVIYYAAAKVPPGVNLGVGAMGNPQEPEEFLNGKLNGHLRWVQSYAGPNSSVKLAVVVGSQTNTISVNKALFNSMNIDSDGNTIPNGSQTSDPFQLATLGLQVDGNGTVTPSGYSGAPLIVGQTYSLVAQPAAGSTFLGWSGSINSASPQLTFVMADGLNLTASFSYSPSNATFNGLFYESGGVALDRSGAITLTTTTGGTLSGKIQTANGRFSFTGQLDDAGSAGIYVRNSSLYLQVQVSGDRVTGTITDGSWTADVTAEQSVFNKQTNPAPFAGRYTMLFPGSGDPGNTSLPSGDGYGVVTVDPSGRVKLNGSLADGTKITQTATLSADGMWPLYVALKGKGQLLSWQTFAPAADREGGLFSWIKAADSKAKFYPAGFNFQTNTLGSRYDPTLSPVTGFNSGHVTLVGGNLDAAVDQVISVDAANKVTVSGDKKNKVKLVAKQGLFRGKVVNPADGKPVKFSGVVVQRFNAASGYFLGGGLSGRATMAP